MKEYIERGKFLKECMKTFGNMGVTVKAIEDIANECAADVAEVVRCKDCQHCEIHYPSKMINKEPKEVYSFQAERHGVRPDGYCSCGERKKQK